MILCLPWLCLTSPTTSVVSFSCLAYGPNSRKSEAVVSTSLQIPVFTTSSWVKLHPLDGWTVFKADRATEKEGRQTWWTVCLRCVTLNLKMSTILSSASHHQYIFFVQPFVARGWINYFISWKITNGVFTYILCCRTKWKSFKLVWTAIRILSI